MLYLNEHGVEILRKKISNKDIDTYWENYTFIVWKKDNGGYSNTKGVFRNNTWGVSTTFPINKNGVWELPKKYVRHFKQSKRRQR